MQASTYSSRLLLVSRSSSRRRTSPPADRELIQARRKDLACPMWSNPVGLGASLAVGAIGKAYMLWGAIFSLEISSNDEQNRAMSQLDLVTTLVLIASAFLGATISGFLGMGGGIFLLTVLFLCGLEPAVAIPVHALVQLTSNGSRAVLFRERVRWSALRVFALVALPFPLLGLALADRMDPEVTKVAIGALVLFATWRRKGGAVQWGEARSFAAVGVLAGTLGVVVGATGPLVAPFFLRDGWEKEDIIATKAACQIYVHLQKIVAFGLVGFSFSEELRYVAPLALAVVFGSWCGKKVLSHLSEERFRLIYRIVLSGLALRLLVEPLL